MTVYTIENESSVTYANVTEIVPTMTGKLVLIGSGTTQEIKATELYKITSA